MLKNLDNALMEMTSDDLIHEMVVNCEEILDRQEQNEIINNELIKRGSEKNLSENHELYLFLKDLFERR